jgi:type IV pilus assembly protein PilX
MTYTTKITLAPPKQSGVALVVVLIFMLALSAIAIFASRNATMGERQARNETEYQIARQAAEAALRDGERDLYPDPAVPAPTIPACTRTGSVFRTNDRVVSADEFTDACLGGQCWVPAARYAVAWDSATIASGTSPGEPWWPISKGGLWNSSGSTCAAYKGSVPLGRYTGVPPLSGVWKQPDYLIEYIGDPSQDTALIGKGFQCATPLIGVGAALAAADQTTGAAVTSPLMACYLFRITARGFGPSSKTEVMMQSYFSIVKPSAS